MNLWSVFFPKSASQTTKYNFQHYQPKIILKKKWLESTTFLTFLSLIVSKPNPLKNAIVWSVLKDLNLLVGSTSKSLKSKSLLATSNVMPSGRDPGFFAASVFGSFSEATAEVGYWSRKKRTFLYRTVHSGKNQIFVKASRFAEGPLAAVFIRHLALYLLFKQN